MTQAIIGYLIGQYASHHGTFADFNELLTSGCISEMLQTPEVTRYLAIQEFVGRQDLIANKAISALQMQLLTYYKEVPTHQLPFCFLPLAYLPGANMQEVVEITMFLLHRLSQNSESATASTSGVTTELTLDAQFSEQILCLVAAMKWSLTTHSSYVTYISRCFPNIQTLSTDSTSVIEQALSISPSALTTDTDRCELPIQQKLRQACQDPNQAAVRCAIVYALEEVDYNLDYNPAVAHSVDHTISVPFPHRPALTTHIDTHITQGTYRLDGYIDWQLKSKKEPLLDITILGDANGPDRDQLRFWNFCNKHLNWEELANELDQFFSIRTFLRVDWRSKLVGYEIQWKRQRVAFILDNQRYLSFTPHVKKKIFILDKTEAKDAGLPRFQFGTRPAIQLFENFSEKLMGDDSND